MHVPSGIRRDRNDQGSCNYRKMLIDGTKALCRIEGFYERFICTCTSFLPTCILENVATEFMNNVAQRLLTTQIFGI